MQNLHLIQMQILKQLLFTDAARFSDLNIAGLTNDHFSYHMRELIAKDLVRKGDKGNYSLTAKGKELANQMDTDNVQWEKQPKTSVLIIPIREAGGEKEFLVQRRLKQPYYGYIGFMTGKIRYGEKLFQAAARELQEEMGLQAEAMRFCYNLHETVFDLEGQLLEDKFFYVVEAKGLEGEIVTKHESGENFWTSIEEFRQLSPKYHNEDDILGWYLDDDSSFKEFSYYIEQF